MNCKFSKFKSGFSILELLVVMAIALIMTAVLFVNRNSSKSQNDVDTVSRQVAAQIRTLQNEALTGKQINDSGIMKNANEYYFSTAGGGASTYVLSYRDSAGGTINAGTKNLNLIKQRVKFTGAAVNFFFQSPRGEVNPAGSKLITLSDNNDTVLRYICVSSIGNVTEQKTNVCP